MGTDIFLGEPPANIKQWIIDHATPPSPEPIAQNTDGTVKVMSITDRSTGSTSTLVYNNTWDVSGEGFAACTTGEPYDWQIDAILLYTMPGSEPIGLNYNVTSSTTIEITGSEAELPMGDFDEAKISMSLARHRAQGWESDTIQIHPSLIVVNQ